MTDKPETPTPEDHSLDELFQRTPDTEHETAMWPSFSAVDEPTDDEFWGFADTFKQIPRLHRGEEAMMNARDRLLENRAVSRTPPRLVIPPVLRGWSSDELTPLPRAWPAGDVVLAVLVALTTFGLAILLLVK